LLVLFLLRLPFTYLTIYVPGITLIAALYAYRYFAGRGGEGSVQQQTHFSILDKAVMAGIFFEIIHSFFRAFITPFKSFDSIATFAIKAKIFFLHNGIPQDFFTNIGTRFPHVAFPPMIPLQETFCFISMGAMNDVLVKILFPMHFVALLILFYYCVKRITNHRIALIATFLMCSMNELNRFSIIGYTDIHFAIYFSIGFMYMYRFLTRPSKRTFYLFVAGIFSAFAMLTKDVGYIIPAIYFLILLVDMLKKKNVREAAITYARYLVILMLFILPWILVKLRFRFSQEFSVADILNINYLVQAFMAHIIPVLYAIQVNIFNPKGWNLLWPIFIILFIVNFRWSLRTSLKYITLIIVSTFVFYLMVYLFIAPSYYGTGAKYAFHIRDGMNRHLIHIVPLVLMWLAVLFNASVFGVSQRKTS